LLTLDDIQDRQAMHRVIEEAPRQHFGSTKRSYHAMTRGLVVDGILKHVDGRTIGEFATQEIFQPLGIAEGYFVSFDRDVHKNISCGLNRQLPSTFSVCHEIGPALLGMGDPGIARMVQAMGPQSIVGRSGWGLDEGSVGVAPEYMNSNPQARKAEVTSGMCMANARSMTKLMALFCNGGQVNGVRLFSEETARTALAQVVTEADDTIKATCAFSQGGLCDIGTSKDPEDKIDRKEWVKGFWGWGGWGGSINLFHPEAKVTVSYAMTAMGNHMFGDDRTDKIMTAVAQAISNK
jgi:CubicO group peptidase (beta-lactamase class C family)